MIHLILMNSRSPKHGDLEQRCGIRFFYQHWGAFPSVGDALPISFTTNYQVGISDEYFVKVDKFYRGQKKTLMKEGYLKWIILNMKYILSMGQN